MKQPSVSKAAKKDSLKQNLFDFWGVTDCKFIGYYHYDDKRDSYIVNDLRKANFDNIPCYINDDEEKPIEIVLPHEIRGLKLNEYHQFTWKLSHRNHDNPYELAIDFSNSPKPINPREFIDKLFDDRHNDQSKNFSSATNFLDTLSKQLSANETTFVYELLQNAADYPVEGKGVDVEFHITDRHLLFLHSGDKFNVRNISGICGINEKEKVANKKTIGYKGIGFKTVFLNNHYVYIRTGEYSFRFDKNADKIKRHNAPWPILPVWTEHDEVDAEINNVFDNADKKFNVEIALRPNNKNLLHSGKNNYEKLFQKVFADSNIILFISNINSVKVFINGKEDTICIRDTKRWIVNGYDQDINLELQQAINKTIDKGTSRIPEKFKNFNCTRVSFACQLNGRQIVPVKKAILYCYLPTKASWGFPFLLNTDMIPKGDRNDIETEVDLLDESDSNFNKELATIAGSKLIDWIADLIASDKYELGTIFSLIPDFEKCKNEHDYYEDFIECFEEAFNARIDNVPLIPIDQGTALTSDVVLDKTGLSSSGIMTDEEFLRFTGKQEYSLPLPELRDDEHFNSFLDRYVYDEQVFSENDLRDLIANDDFQEWLKDQGNNNKFLKFLLDNNYLEDLLDANIFLEDEGSLNAANELFYDVDKYLVDLEAFTDHIAFLSRETREYFKGNKKWKNVIGNEFAEFNCDEFVDDTLLDYYTRSETIERLKDMDTSIHFYKFLAENVEFSAQYLDLPFFDANNNVVEEFNNRFLFFPSKRGQEICDSDWLSNINISFVSPQYHKKTKEYFKENFDVCQYSDKFIIDEIIKPKQDPDDDYCMSISNAIDNDFVISRDFVRFCFDNRDCFAKGELSQYTLKSFDCDGDELWSNENVFFGSPCFDYYSQKEWLVGDWMTVIDEGYFTDSTKEEFTEFLHKTFGVKELTDKTFYTDVVRPNLRTIFENTSGSADSDGAKNFDFVKYLDDNYKLIFTEKKDFDRFGEFILVTTDNCDADINEENLYLYDEELKEIVEADWFPSDLVTLCSSEYGNSKALAKLGVKQYRFSSFFDDIISPNIESINGNISCKEESISFHNFVISHLRSLNDDQRGKMQNASVYLYGNDTAADKSSEHKILSNKAKELLNSGLVEFSALDIIDPDYNPDKSTKYWEETLGNSPFTPKHFYEWIEANLEDFCQTLQDRSLNLKFWRWAKKNTSDKLQEIASRLPILLKNGDQPVYLNSNTVYISNEYLGNGGIESLVREYNEHALFICPEYIEEDSDRDSWKDFWINAGIKHDIIDILVGSAIPNLAEIENEELLHIFAENRDALDGRYSESGGLIKQLEQLRIKAHDGNFYTVHEAIYVDCEKDEPFTYIELPSQITFASADDRRLAKDIIAVFNGKCIDSLSEWQQCKLGQYLELQDNNPDAVREFHYQFINDLALIKDSNTLKELKRITEIKLLNREGQFCDASTLTMGSVYNPFFDFEACGLALDYVSDTYKTQCSQYINPIFGEMKVHRDFRKEDISYLENRKCAIYFWGTYLTAQYERDRKNKTSIVNNRIINDYFDDIEEIACIPTKGCMKRPDELYYGSDVTKYIRYVSDWENKTPLEELPDIKLSEGSTIFAKLPFKQSLSFMDSLEALENGINKKNDRKKLLEWMIEDYNASNKESCDHAIREYRDSDNAKWINTKNEPTQIKELYALDDSDKDLQQILGDNPRIIDKNYLPTGDKFRRACDILGIKTITLEDLEFEGIDKSEYCGHNELHKLYALAFAGNIDAENWKALYDQYCEKLTSLTIYECKEIHFAYKEDNSINQSRLFKFYYDKADTFYFVKELGSKATYSEYVSAFIRHLGIEGKVQSTIANNIMEDNYSAIEYIQDKNNLMIDECFMEELCKFAPELRGKLSGNKVDVENGQPTGTTSGRTTVKPVDDHVDEPLESPIYGNTTTEKGQTEEGGSSNTYEGSSHNNGGEINPVHSSVPSNTTSKPSEGSYSTGGTDTPSNGSNRTPSTAGEEDSTYTRTQNGFTATEEEKSELKALLDCDLSEDAIRAQNYLVRLRFYKFLEKNGYVPKDNESDFIKKNAQSALDALDNGKYIHVCSAAGGIMYLSPSIWNKIEDDNCMVCAYLGSHGEDFVIFNSLDEIKKQIDQDAVLIKLSGRDKFDVVKDLYSKTLNGVTGTAYTMIRVKSDGRYNSVFEKLFKSRGYNDDDV